ncbi:MAG: DUF3794 domain-containing protein [Clostridiales bacterium]|nr:DUF3794 domain-containing protein [Clostridiales bacterium]
MEFNQENRSFRTPVTVLDTVAEQLADVDLTLPDYCPDIEKILKCTLVPKIQSKSLSGGQLQVDGYCIVNVLYVESIKKTIRCCEQSVNFSQCFSVKETPDNAVIVTKTKSEYINCRALSPRRLVMHGAFSLYAKVYSTAEIQIYSPDSDKNVEVRRTAVRCADLTSFCQEQFNICEEVSVSDKPAIESILRSDLSVSLSETKAVTGKLMINGEINLKMLYLTDIESGETGKIDYLLPFNQVIDCEGIDENTINCVACDVMSYDIRLKNDVLSEKPVATVDVKLCVTEEGYVINDETVITDAYSVFCASKPEFEQLKIASEVMPAARTHMEKTAVKIDDGKISRILDIYADYVSAEKSFDEDGLKINGKINICILALNEDNMPVFIERSADYSHSASVGEEFNAADCVEARAASISYRLSDDSTIEIRCELKISAFAVKYDTLKAVKSVELFEDKPIKTDNCALTLYFAQEGESLWDIAKSHNTRLDILAEENSTDKQTLEHPQMLLIPKI